MSSKAKTVIPLRPTQTFPRWHLLLRLHGVHLYFSQLHETGPARRQDALSLLSDQSFALEFCFPDKGSDLQRSNFEA